MSTTIRLVPAEFAEKDANETIEYVPGSKVTDPIDVCVPLDTVAVLNGT